MKPFGEHEGLKLPTFSDDEYDILIHHGWKVEEVQKLLAREGIVAEVAGPFVITVGNKEIEVNLRNNSDMYTFAPTGKERVVDMREAQTTYISNRVSVDDHEKNTSVHDISNSLARTHPSEEEVFRKLHLFMRRAEKHDDALTALVVDLLADKMEEGPKAFDDLMVMLLLQNHYDEDELADNLQLKKVAKAHLRAVRGAREQRPATDTYRQFYDLFKKYGIFTDIEMNEILRED